MYIKTWIMWLVDNGYATCDASCVKLLELDVNNYVNYRLRLLDLDVIRPIARSWIDYYCLYIPLS